MSEYLQLFIALVETFESGGMESARFKQEYMRLWRRCRDEGALEPLNRSRNNVFDRIFTACDVYCEEPALRDPWDLDERQFFKEVVRIAGDLNGFGA